MRFCIPCFRPACMSEPSWCSFPSRITARTAAVATSTSTAATLPGPYARGTRTWVATPSSTDASWPRTCACRAAGKASMMRLTESAAEFVCSVERTRCPVSAMVRAEPIVSGSRISPIRDDVGILPERTLQRAGEAPRIGAHLALVHDAAAGPVDELDGVLDGEDMAPAPPVDPSRPWRRGSWICPSPWARSPEQARAAAVRSGSVWTADPTPPAAPLPRVCGATRAPRTRAAGTVPAKAGELRRLEGEVELVVLLEAPPLGRGKQGPSQSNGVLGRESIPVLDRGQRRVRSAARFRL